QAEDGIRDFHVTGVQTCALPISSSWTYQFGKGKPSPPPPERNVQADVWQPLAPPAYVRPISRSLSAGLARRLDIGLRRGQPGDGHPEGRAADVVHAHPVAELHRRRIAAVLAADADLEVGPGLAAALHADLHQLAYAVLVQALEGILLQDALVQVGREEVAGVVPAVAEGKLREVVRPEGEELGLLRDLVGQEHRP